MPYFCNFRRIILRKTVNQSENLHRLKTLADFFLSVYISPMLKKIIKGYAEILSSISKVIILLALCLGIGLAFVYPLWYFATNFPHTYTFFLLAISVVFIFIWALKKIKRVGLSASLFFLAKILLIAFSATIFVILVFNGKRFLTIPLVIASLLIYGFLSLNSKNHLRKSNEEPIEE